MENKSKQFVSEGLSLMNKHNLIEFPNFTLLVRIYFFIKILKKNRHDSPSDGVIPRLLVFEHTCSLYL